MLQDIAAIEADAAPAHRGGGDPRRAARARPGAARQAVAAVVVQGEARRPRRRRPPRGRRRAQPRSATRSRPRSSARRAELEAVARREQLAAERLDLTEVPPDRGAGHLHLVTQAMETPRGRVHRHGLHHRRGPRGGDRLAQLRRAQLPARPPGARHVRHALRGDGRAGLHRAAHPHLAGAGAGDDRRRSRPSTW